MPPQDGQLCGWWEQQDKTPFVSALLLAPASAATGDAAARETFKEALRTWVALRGNAKQQTRKACYDHR